MSELTKKDVERIARGCKLLIGGKPAVAFIEEDVIPVLQSSNPRFNLETFRKASGIICR